MDLDIYLLSKPALGSDPFTLDFLDNGFQICGNMMKNGVEKTSLSVRTNFFESVKADSTVGIFANYVFYINLDCFVKFACFLFKLLYLLNHISIV